MTTQTNETDIQTVPEPAQPVGDDHPEHEFPHSEDALDRIHALEVVARRHTRRFPPKVATGLVKAQAAAKAASNDSRNAFHNFDYTSADAVMEMATSALEAAGLAFVALDWWFEDAPKWNVQAFTYVVVEYVLTHESGEESRPLKYRHLAMRDRGRPEDKGINAALTTIQGYALRGLLNIPRPKGGEADDIAGRDDTNYQPEPQQEQQRETQTRTVPKDGGSSKPRRQSKKAGRKAADKPKGGKQEKDGRTTYQMDKQPETELEQAQAMFKKTYGQWYSVAEGREWTQMVAGAFGKPEGEYDGDCKSIEEIETMTLWLEKRIEVLTADAARAEQDATAEGGGA